MSGFQRPEGGWRFPFHGVKISDTPDALEATESPYAQNIRRYKDNTVQTRPGYTQLFTANTAAVTDIRAYSTLETDSLPRFLARNANNQIYLDNSVLVATLSGASPGAFLIPYRPSQSPQSWMYIGAVADYKKLSAPDSIDTVLAYDVGIAEQQSPPDACPDAFNFYQFSGIAAGWAQGGTAGGPSDEVRLGDTLGDVIQDPASGAVKRCSCQVTAAEQYQVGMTVVVDAGGIPITAVVQDILPPINSGVTITVDSIHYFTGSSGRCIIVPTQQPSSPSIPLVKNNIPIAASIYSDAVLSSLRRGSIVNLDNGVDPDENLFVLSATVGPKGTICFEVVTAATYSAADNITGIPAVILSGVTSANTGDSIDAVNIKSNLTGPGTGTLSQVLATNPFEQFLSPSTNTPQSDDYIGFSVNISDLSKFVLGTITFNTEPGGGSPYDTNAFYAQFDSSNLIFHQPAVSRVTQTVIVTDVSAGPSQQAIDLAAQIGIDPNWIDQNLLGNDFTGNIQEQQTVVTTTTPLPVAQFTTVMFPARALTRLGNDLTKTLADCNGVRISIQTSDSVVVRLGSFFIGGGGQSDVGNNGSPYFYSVVGRNSATGAKSNPSPITRYGVSPRRQSVRVTMQDDTADPQLDTWDVFRYGGSVTSWRYIGSTPNTGALDSFTDDYFDSAANAGSGIEYDNFEPWPTIDIPFTATAGTVNGIVTAISVVGDTALVVYYSVAAFISPVPSTITRWLPGTLVSIGGQNAYTLFNRPTAVTLASPPAAFYYAYLFQFIENAGTLTPNTFHILEPNIANQHLPYLWGPDANGTVFGAGDPFRPGSFYFCKNFAPDSAPDSYNQELTPPSEPILGGEVINGLSMTASSSRWWRLYPQFNNIRQRYQAVEAPVGRGLAAPYAHCTDGKRIFFVAKDGVWMTAGGEGISLTDDALYNLFPHEGINTPADYTYATFTISAPDYRYASLFRLSFINGFLYFDYRDSGNNPRTLTADLTDMEHIAWVPDIYSDDRITVHYAVEQPESTLETTNSRYPLMVMGDLGGFVHEMSPNTNDNGDPINGVIATFEYNGGDIRAGQLFNDAFADITPAAGLSIRGISAGVPVGVVKVVAASPTRLQTNAPLGLELKYLGVLFSWVDNFNTQSAPTMIHAWQPMYQAVPVSVFLWKTQATSFGWMAYGHLRQWNFTYRSAADVVITITAYDGTSPAPITLPSTGGNVRKTMFPFTFNKGMLYFFEGLSSAEWAPYLSESELYTGAWARSDAYQLVHDIEAAKGIRS